MNNTSNQTEAVPFRGLPGSCGSDRSQVVSLAA
jgi:hypothetical protein